MARDVEYRLTLTAEIARYVDGASAGERLTVTDELTLPALEFQDAAKILGELRDLAQRRAAELRSAAVPAERRR